MAHQPSRGNGASRPTEGRDGAGQAKEEGLRQSGSAQTLTRWPFVIVIVFVVAAGAVFMILSAREAEEVMKRAMLAEAKMLVESIDQGRFSRLTATAADEQNPDYHDLRDTLVRMRAANPTFRYLYLMGQRESGPPFFYMGTAPAGTAEYSPPGQPYPEEAPALKHVFATGEATVSDPVTDRWGTWVSMLVPLRDRDTGRMLAVFGMDVDASDWQGSTRMRTMLPGALTLVVVFLVVLLFFVLRNRQRSKTEHLLLDKNRLLGIQAAELKKGSELLQTQKDRYRYILEATNVGTWEWNVQTGETVFNERWASIIGYTLEEISPVSIETWMKHAHPEDLQISGEQLEKHFGGQSDYYECELRMRHRNGLWIWVLDRGKVISRTEDGKPLWVYGTHQDITERKRVEESLKESNLFVSSLLNAVPVAVFYKDKFGKYIGCNSVFSAVMGVTEEQIRGKTVHELWPSDLAEKYHLMDLELMRTSGHQVYEYKIKDKDGRVLPVIYAKDVFLDSEGKVAGLVGAFLDITERKRAEETLRQSEATLQTILETIEAGIVVINPDNKVIEFVNSAAARMFGAAVGDITGRKCHRFLCPAEEGKCPISDAGKSLECSERVLLRADGSHLPVIKSVRRIELWGKSRLIETFIDISDRKRTEEVLKESEATFRNIVNASPMGIHLYQMHDDGRLVFTGGNPAADRLLGTDNSAFIGLTLEEAFPSLRDTEVPERYRRAARNGEAWHTEQIDYHDDRLDAAFEVHVFQMSPGKAAVLFNEITERKRAEVELKKKTEELELYFTHSLDLLCIANMDGRFLRLNPEWERVLGYSLSALEGRMFLEFVHPEDHQATLTAVSRLENQEQILNFVNRFRCEDGTYRWIEWRSRPMGEHIYAAARDITDRKQAEEKLQQSEENLARTLESIGDGVISTDKEGRIVRMNPVGENLCGWKASEAKGRHLGEVFRIVHAVTREALQDPVQKVIETGQMVGLANHTLLLAKDGMEYQIADSAAPIIDRQGGIAGAVLVFRDVTQEYARAERLRISEKRLDRAMSVKNEGVWEWNLVTNETYFDDRYYTMAGYEPNEFPQDYAAWAEHIHPEDLEKTTSALSAYLSGNIDVFDVEFRFKHKDGSWIWIQGRGKIVDRDADGSPLCMIGTHADITKRKLAEAAQCESEELQRSLLQTVPDLILRTDPDGKIVFVNEFAFAGMDYIPGESIHGKSIFSFIDDQDRSRAMENARQRLEKDIGPQEYRLQFQDGARIDSEINGAVVRDREGQAVGMVYVVRNISDRKRAEKDKAELQTQLVQAQKMESLGTLAGGVAHDFNNILQAISGNIEFLMMNKPTDHPDIKRLKIIDRSMDRAAQLVKQLLLFSRKAEVKKVLVDLNHEVEGVARILERAVPKMVSLHLHLDPEIFPVLGDPVQIETVLLNLASNSVHAMPDGGRLTFETRNAVLDEECVRQHPHATPGDHVLLQVTDTGCGMDEATLEHIFDPFFTTREVGKGTGLGLASVFGIVKGHGGFIRCQSSPGQGSTFMILLPASVEGGKERVEDRQWEDAPVAGTETILVVDDEADVLNLAVEVLRDNGYKTISATSGEEALAQVAEKGREIDLVVLDLNMPGIGGQKCLEGLLRINPSLRVLVVSGYAADGQVGNLPAGHNVGFLGKPYKSRELLARVRKAIDGGNAG